MSPPTTAAKLTPPAQALVDASPKPRVVPRRTALQRTYVWDLVVRLTHWLIAGSLVVLAVTGIYIGDPFIISAGPAGEHFVMGTMKVIHFYGSIVFTLAVLSRLLWLFVGSPNARWRNFIPVTAERRRALRETFLFYVFVRKRPPPSTGHNPLAGLAYVAVFVLYLVMIITGVALYSVSAGIASPLRGFDFLLGPLGGAQTARWIHHVVMWLLIAFVVQHVYSAILMALVEKNGTIDSIFSGYKWVKRKGSE